MGELLRPQVVAGIRKWAAYILLQLIPMGYTITYSALAEALSTSPRAVGAYMRCNTTPIVVPCHRVVGAKSLGGYSLGLEFKEKLLKLEGALGPGNRPIRVIKSSAELFKVAEEHGAPLEVELDP